MYLPATGTVSVNGQISNEFSTLHPKYYIQMDLNPLIPTLKCYFIPKSHIFLAQILNQIRNLQISQISVAFLLRVSIVIHYFRLLLQSLNK